MSPDERCVFEIPIYWCSEADFNARYDEAVKRHFATKVRAGLRGAFRRLLEQEFDRRYVAPWQYNQAVGWLRLCVSGREIRAEEWFTNARRFGRNVLRKQFTLFGKVFVVNCAGQSSRAIFESLAEELNAFQVGSSRKVVLDLECFTSIGPFVNWRGLVDTAA